jgi:tRNA(Ile)-lysidine synthase
MDGLDDAVPRTRVAVKRLLATARDEGLLDSGRLAVAVSGGADSLALAAASTYLAAKENLVLQGLIVDHRLQRESAEVAAKAKEQLDQLGLDETKILTVDVTGSGGIEAAARRARYTALKSAAPDTLVLLGHTLDDQAETVLLGLGRGSGPRSIAGMRALDPPWGRPFLDLPRRVTLAACERLNLTPWHDPHNTDPRFTRVRLRGEVLPLLEDVLAGGVAPALARTAKQLREDVDALDDWAAKVAGQLIESELTPGKSEPDPAGSGVVVKSLVDLPVAVRRRVVRLWLRAAGVAELTDPQLRAVDELVVNWRGQGGVWLPGGLVVRRAHGRLHLDVGVTAAER